MAAIRGSAGIVATGGGAVVVVVVVVVDVVVDVLVVVLLVVLVVVVLVVDATPVVDVVVEIATVPAGGAVDVDALVTGTVVAAGAAASDEQPARSTATISSAAAVRSRMAEVRIEQFGDGDRERPSGRKMQVLVGAVGVGVRAEYPGDHELRLRESLAEHAHERD